MTTHFGTLIQVSITAAILTVAVNSEKAQADNLDTPVRQVLIESRIVTANDDFNRELGVQYGFDSHHQYGYGTGNFELDALNGAEQGSFEAGQNIQHMQHLDRLNQYNNSYQGQTEGNYDHNGYGSTAYEGLISAIEKQESGEVLSNPRVTTLNNQEATIEQGSEIPYQQNSSPANTTTQFKDAVLELEVTPQITPDDRIIMDLNVKQDNGQYNEQAYNPLPSIDTRHVRTNVLVNNGETVVLGGVYNNNSNQKQDKAPYLSDIPGVGELFKNKHAQRDKEQLLIFVTPQITQTAE